MTAQANRDRLAWVVHLADMSSFCLVLSPVPGLQGAFFRLSQGGCHSPSGAGLEGGKDFETEPPEGGAHAGGVSGARVSGRFYGRDARYTRLRFIDGPGSR